MSLKCHSTFAVESTSGGFLWAQVLIQTENRMSWLNLSLQPNSFCFPLSFLREQERLGTEIGEAAEASASDAGECCAGGRRGAWSNG